MKMQKRREDLDRLIDDAARDLPRIDPPDHLWKRIESDLRDAQREARDNGDHVAAPGRWLGLHLLFVSRPRLMYAAYGIVLVLGFSAALYLMTTHYRGDEQQARAPEESEQLMAEARDDIDQAMFFYERAIGKLTELAKRNEKNLDPSYVVIQNEKIAALREAIAECKTALDQNRYHPDVQQYLLTAYIDLQNTLQEMASKDQSL